MKHVDFGFKRSRVSIGLRVRVVSNVAFRVSMDLNLHGVHIVVASEIVGECQGKAREFHLCGLVA